MNGVQGMNITFTLENGKRVLRDQGVDGMIILKWSLNKNVSEM
jgi:hypothetical protein